MDCSPNKTPIEVVTKNVNMLQYEKTDVSEGIDINKMCLSKEYGLCHYWFF